MNQPIVNGRRSYPAIAIAAIAAIWTFNVFEVMSFASRAFAAYYAIQCVIATITAVPLPGSKLRTAKLVGFPILAACALAIAIFAIPFE